MWEFFNVTQATKSKQSKQTARQKPVYHLEIAQVLEALARLKELNPRNGFVTIRYNEKMLAQWSKGQLEALHEQIEEAITAAETIPDPEPTASRQQAMELLRLYAQLEQIAPQDPCLANKLSLAQITELPVANFEAEVAAIEAVIAAAAQPEPVAPVQAEPPAAQADAEPPAQMSKKAAVWWGVALVSALIVIGGLTLLGLNMSGTSSSAPQNTRPQSSSNNSPSSDDLIEETRELLLEAQNERNAQ